MGGDLYAPQDGHDRPHKSADNSRGQRNSYEDLVPPAFGGLNGFLLGHLGLLMCD